MASSDKTNEPYEVVTAEAEEREAVELRWDKARGSKLRKPPKDYKYVDELAYLQFELIKLQEWVRLHGLKVVILFEGRDAAGKGGAIKRITEPLNPRVCRVVALGTPTERERGQWYFQRYVAHLPAEGEIVLFDRSWYNRAGVEHVMGFCTDEEYQEFLRSVPAVRGDAGPLRHPSSSSTGSRSTTRSRNSASRSGSKTRSSSGSSARWTSSRASAGWTTPRPRT